MKSITLMTLFVFSLLVTLLGCGKNYQSINVDTPKTELKSYEGQRLTVVGVPESAKRGDFLAPTPLHNGHWILVVNGIKCIETVNFENEPRIRSLLQTASTAHQQQRPIAISGKVSRGQLNMEFLEGARTDTSWYKKKNPFYSYGEYYEWFPFAYRPNGKVFKTWGVVD